MCCASVNELVDHLNSKIRNVIDAIAPIKVKTVSSKKRSPWRNSVLVRIEKIGVQVNASGEKQISMVIMKSIKRDFAFII